MDANIVTTQFSAAALVVFGLQKLKSAKWFPWVQHEGQVWLKRGISVATALAIHTGISHVWEPDAAMSGYHKLILTIPPGSVIAVGIWHWFGQYAIQETLYQVTGNRVAISMEQK